jgi:hypothetical protein
MPDPTLARLHLTSRCLCGACRFHIDGSLAGVIHCHCRRCRKFHGATFATYAVFEGGKMQWSGGREQIDRFMSGDLTRPVSFCRQCGSPAPNPDKESGSLTFAPHASSIVDLPPPPFEYHFYLASRALWYRPPVGAPHLYDVVAPNFRDPGLPELVRQVDGNKICGSCLCGDVTFEAASVRTMVDCSCIDCRLSRGALWATELIIAAEEFRWAGGEDRIRFFEHSNYRVNFCGRCGSPVPRKTTDGASIAVPAGLLDNDPGTTPTVTGSTPGVWILSNIACRVDPIAEPHVSPSPSVNSTTRRC